MLTSVPSAAYTQAISSLLAARAAKGPLVVVCDDVHWTDETSVDLLVPAAAPLIAMFMLGNLFREAKVVERLTHASQNELLNIVTIFLGLPVGATMNAQTFLQPKVLFIFFFGLFAFIVSTAAGILLAKLMNLFRKEKINPLLGAAGVSAVPMAARVVHKVGSQYDKKNYLLMFAMGPNVAGVIGTVTVTETIPLGFEVENTGGGVESGDTLSFEFSADGSTLNGSVKTDFDLDVEKHLVGRSLSGRVGSAKYSLRVKTVNGGIKILAI